MLRHYDWQYIKRSQCFLESKALEVLLKEFAAEPSSHTRENGIFTTVITRPRGLRIILGLVLHQALLHVNM
jgi:hypothetical protein